MLCGKHPQFLLADALLSTLYEIEPFCFTLPDVLVMMMVILIGSIT